MNEQTPDPLDKTLTESLQSRWPARAIPEHQVQTLLANIETQNRKFTMQTRVSNLLRPVAFIGGLALLVLTLSWIFGSMRPNPASEMTPTPTVFSTLEGGGLPTEVLDPDATPTPTPAGDVVLESSPTPEIPPAALPSSGFISMPNVTFTFADALPSAPAQLTLYQQHPEGELTEDAVRAVAAQMGLNGEITSYNGEGGDLVYDITDGALQMIFYGFPDQFSYFINPPVTPTLAEPLPFDQRVAIAEEFLNAHNLLTFPYRAEPSDTDPNGVRFVELLEGIPLLYGIGKNPGMIERINISIDSAGQVHSLFHSNHNYQPLDAYPLLTAEQAWARLATDNAETRARYAVLAPPMSWTRTGTEPTEALTGYLSNENGDTTFFADDGRSFPLLDIPADMPLYPSLEIQGTVTDNSLAWSAIKLIDYGYGSVLSCGGGGGGGGSSIPEANFGGGNFARVALDSGSSPAPSDFIIPLKQGDAIEGVQGILNVYRILHADGSEALQYNFWYPGDENNPGWFGQLTGDALTGTETLQNLPLKIWGTVTASNGVNPPVVAVDRYEEAYPGLQIQAWLGTQQIITLEGQEIVLLNTSDGNQYVLDSSIEWGPEGSLIGTIEDSVIVEGYLLPGQTFGKYSVIKQLMGMVAAGRTDLNGYELESTRSAVMDESESVDPASVLTGHITIENVELMYTAVTLTQCSPDSVNNLESTHFLYAQPVWRFTGHFDDGRLFEVQIQALPDEYLQ